VELWTEEGTGAFNSWTDTLELGRRKDGAFSLRLRRRGIDHPGTFTLYRSRPFRTPHRFLQELQRGVADGAGEQLSRDFSQGDLFMILAELIDFDPMLARDSLRTLARQVGSVSALSSDLWRAYERTVLCATVDGSDIRIRPGHTSPSLDRVLETRAVSTWAYITAWNPGSTELSRSENDVRHARLKEELMHLGYEAFEGHGEPADSDWAPEQSLLVLGVSEEDAVAIGRSFGQSAIVAGERGSTAKLVKV
jgi:hypothetical protein